MRLADISPEDFVPLAGLGRGVSLNGHEVVADYPERVCQFTPGIRYDRIMNALGGQGMRVESVQQVAPALRQAFASGRPVLIQVDTRDDVPLPRL